MPEPAPPKAGPWGDRKLRPAYPVAPRAQRSGGYRYAELHCHTNFSFLDGASPPEDLMGEAARLGLEALAVTDHDGLYGAVRFSEVGRALAVPTVFGAEVTLNAA